MNMYSEKGSILNGFVLLMQTGVLCFTICGTAITCFEIVKRWENTEWIQSRERKMLCVLYSMAVACCIRLLSCASMERFLLCVIAGCLLFAGVTDALSSEVYRFTWWIAGMACIALWICRGEYVQLLSFSFFLLLQEIFFSRFYGRADCHAFVICAGAGYVFGWEWIHCFLHMTVAFGILCVVQVFRGNIGSRGRLKQPVPFLSYITGSFWLLMALHR